MTFSLLGPMEVVRDGRVVAVGGGRRRALLAILLLNANEVVSTDRLIDELWGERAPATAAKSVQVYVSQLRKTLHSTAGSPNGEPLITRGNGYMLRVDPDELDIQRFERAVADAQRHLAADDPARAAKRLREGLALWRGPPLHDVAYESFAQQEIARLEELRLEALETRVEADMALGAHAHLVGELEALVGQHPLREHFRGQLMLALYRCDRQPEALAVYRAGRKLLGEDLGLEPSSALRRLESEILAQSEALAPPRIPSARPRAPRRSGPAAGTAAPPASAWRRARPRGPALLVGGALLLGAATALALTQSLGGGESSTNAARIDAAKNSIVLVDTSKRRPELVLPLPGRPTDVAAAGDHAWITTVDSAGVTGVDARRQAISRTVPLGGRPDAVAVGAGSVWVADGSRGTLVRIRPGYATVQERISYPRGPAAPTSGSGRLRTRRSALAVGAGGVWITNGSATLIRVDPRTSKVTTIPARRALNAVSVGAGAVWALSSRSADVLRISPRTYGVTDRIQLAGRSGVEAPSPIGVAATTDAVWILNGNTATVTRIDPATREIVGTTALGVDRVPGAIAADGKSAWVADGDGTLSRIDASSTVAKAIWVGGSLERVAAGAGRVWATTAAFDQRLPGGAG